MMEAKSFISPDPPRIVGHFDTNNPNITFPDNFRTTEEEKNNLKDFSEYFVRLLLKIPKSYLEWTPKKFIFIKDIEKITHYTEEATKELAKKGRKYKKRSIPDEYEVKIKDSGSLIKYLRSHSSGKGVKSDSDEKLVINDLISIMEANPYKKFSIKIERQYEPIKEPSHVFY